MPDSSPVRLLHEGDPVFIPYTRYPMLPPEGDDELGEVVGVTKEPVAGGEGEGGHKPSKEERSERLGILASMRSKVRYVSFRQPPPPLPNGCSRGGESSGLDDLVRAKASQLGNPTDEGIGFHNPSR